MPCDSTWSLGGVCSQGSLAGLGVGLNLDLGWCSWSWGCTWFWGVHGVGITILWWISKNLLFSLCQCLYMNYVPAHLHWSLLCDLA